MIYYKVPHDVPSWAIGRFLQAICVQRACKITQGWTWYRPCGSTNQSNKDSGLSQKKKEHLTDLTLVESSQHVFFKHTFCCCKKKSDEFHLSTSQSNFFPWFLKINLSQKSHKKSTSSNAGFFWGSDSPLHGGPLEFIITSKSSQGYG